MPDDWIEAPSHQRFEKVTQAKCLSDSAFAQGTTNNAIAMIKSFARVFMVFSFSLYIKAIVIPKAMK